MWHGVWHGVSLTAAEGAHGGSNTCIERCAPPALWCCACYLSVYTVRAACSATMTCLHADTRSIDPAACWQAYTHHHGISFPWTLQCSFSTYICGHACCVQVLAIKKPKFSQLASSLFGLFYCGACMACQGPNCYMLMLMSQATIHACALWQHGLSTSSTDVASAWLHMH